MDDIVPLRALAGNAAPAMHLFPGEGPRERAGFTGTPMPKDEPLAPNPPLGAMIDYALPAGSRCRRDRNLRSGGGLVNRFSSADPVKPIDLSKLAVAPEWVVSAEAAVGRRRDTTVSSGTCITPSQRG